MNCACSRAVRFGTGPYMAWLNELPASTAVGDLGTVERDVSAAHTFFLTLPRVGCGCADRALREGRLTPRAMLGGCQPSNSSPSISTARSSTRETISPANRAAIKRRPARGVRVVLVTGRGADAPLAFARDLGLTDPVICAHGALTKDFPSGRERRHIAVPREYATPLIEFAQEHRLDTAVYTDEHFHRLAGAPRYMEDMRGPSWVEVPDLIPLAERRLDVHSVSSAKPRSTRSARVLAECRCISNTRRGATSKSLRSPAKRRPKNTRSRSCAAIFASPPSAVLAIGDSRNDVPMLRWAGVGVAMANALPEVIEAVPYVTAEQRRRRGRARDRTVRARSARRRRKKRSA